MSDKTRSLLDLSVQKIIFDPVLLEEMNTYLNEVHFAPEVLFKAPETLFSPELNKTEWISQLEVLQAFDASIGGIPCKEFNDIELVDLKDIACDQLITKLSKRKSGLLIVIFGECQRDFHLCISSNVTVIGSEATISAGNKKFKLKIPKAIISCNKKFKETYKRNDWAIVTTEGEELFNSYTYKAGAGPLVFLKESNIVGVELRCNNYSQGVVSWGILPYQKTG